MPIRKYIDAFMAKLGYVPRLQVEQLRAAIERLSKSIDDQAASVPLKIEVDNSQVRETLPLLEQMTVAAKAAEAALAKLWNIQAAMRNGSPCTGAGGATSKSVLEDEMKRRGVLRDTPPDKL